MVAQCANFVDLRRMADYAMQNLSSIVPPGRWQGVDVKAKPAYGTHEVFNFCASVPMSAGTDLLRYQQDIRPNLPWADAHFDERVCGEPVNPGETWKSWPWSLNADKFRDDNGQFNHNYMERYWPKFAGLTADGCLGSERHAFDGEDWKVQREGHRGIRHLYGDLGDVIDQLDRDITTRQAYLPIFFPEDTGAVHGGRIPCSLGYHLLCRDSRMHISYFMRSCDLRRHFNDDVYLTVRLALWVIERLRERGHSLVPGEFTIFTSSLHLFRNDWHELYPGVAYPS